MRILGTSTRACLLALALAGTAGAFPPGGEGGPAMGGGMKGGGMMGGGSAAAKPAAKPVGKIAKFEGGQTVAEVFTRKAELSGKEVAVRGQIVKVSSGVMGKNWLHLQDGSGAAGSNDLTVTTAATAKVGDVVVVKGKLSTDKDFGYGYKYDAIVEDANVTKE